jgi:methionine synthase I (cobalamin-dependent)/5,10-methylenetetrahydrofolate reductase
MMIHPFRQRLQQDKPILADGAMGTQLYERLGYRYVCFEELNSTAPQLVQSVHRAYILAGAELIETNTFGCNRFLLGMHGLEKKVERLAQAGVRLAREARESMGADIFVAGAVGPLNRTLGISTAAMRAAFREAIEGLLLGGVDLFVLETFGSLEELLLALEVCRSCSDLPVIASMTYAEDGKTLAGEEPAVVSRTLSAAGADVIGANCGFGPQPIFAVVEQMRHPGGKPLSAMPNAGLPARVDGRLVYTTTPEYFAEYAQRLATIGVRVIGGCCGTTPAHIAAMHASLTPPRDEAKEQQADSAAPILTAPSPTSPSAVPPIEMPPIPPPKVKITETSGEFARALSAGEFVISIEMRPSRGPNPAKLLRAAQQLKEAGVTVVDVTDSAMARVRMNPFCTAYLIQSHVGLEVITHLTTRDRNLMALQADLLGMHALGLRYVLALTGDPPNTNSWAPATGVYDVDSIGLITLIKRLNEGQDAAGTSIGTPTNFLVGCSFNPMAEDLENELERFTRKLEAGADFVITQPIYDPDLFLRVMDRLGPLPVPLLLGLMPLQSYKNAEFIHNELAGVTLPSQVLERMRAAGSNGAAVGLEIAYETFHALRHRVQGIYIMPAFDRYEAAGELARQFREELMRETLSSISRA